MLTSLQRHDRLSTSFVEIGYNSPNLSNQLGLVSKCSLCSDLQGEDDFPELNRRWFGPIRNFLSWFTCYGQASLFPFPFALDQWEKIAALTLPYRKSCVSHEKSLIERLRELYPSRWQAVMSFGYFYKYMHLDNNEANNVCQINYPACQPSTKT